VVGEAGTGAAALALAAEVAPQLVVLDVQLPDVDGFEVAAQLRADNPEIRIVLVSSRDRTAYGPRIEASGACGFIAKGELSGTALEQLIE
jgi:DNA-binding NarL/FixJ family response regulator